MAQLPHCCVVQIETFTQLQSRQARRWLMLGVLSLAISGLFAILLVLSRTPGVGEIFPWVDFFHTALVVHVDQSVLIWFLSMVGVILAVAQVNKCHDTSRYLHNLAVAFALAGTLGIAVSAFIGDGSPLMNNYVPVLQRPVFFYALGLFVVGILLQILLSLIAGFATQKPLLSCVSAVAALTIVVSCLVALAVFLWTWINMPAGLDGESYYEYLFWGAGHTLQFAFTQALLFAWLLLVDACGGHHRVQARGYSMLLLLGFLPVLLVPVVYLLYPAVSAEMRISFTRLMQWGGGVAALPIGLLLFIAMLKRAPLNHDFSRIPLRNSFWMSLLLFASGGVIGIMIRSVNTVIPAHYHGSIVGVTLAFMGLAYLLMPRLGYQVIQGRLANWQPLIYGAGQLMHITGLALSGALGVQRKTAGAAQGLEGLGAKLTMGIMGAGGLLAVVGGILFVWVMVRAFILGRQIPRTNV